MGDTGIVRDVEIDFLEFLRMQPGDFTVQISKINNHCYISASISQIPEGVEGDGPTFAVAWSQVSAIFL